MKKQLILFCTLFFVCFGANVSTIQAQTSGDPYVILVEFSFDEKNIDTAIELLSEMQTQTLENEEGCLVYDVLLSEEDETKIFIYESYESEAAYKIHSNSAYFKDIVTKKLQPLIKTSKITKLIPLNQEEGYMNEEP